MEKIRYEDWPRREAYELFSAVSHPFYSVTFTVDVTDLYEYVKREGLSFYYGLVYLCTQAVNETPDFLHVIRDGEIFRLDERMPSFTDLAPGAEQFHVVTMPAAGTIGEFCRRAREVSRGQTKFIDGEAETDELIYFSCLPWFDLTAMTNERNFDRDDTIPRISWGKYVDRAGRKELHMSVEVNHRMIDGLHLGRFYERLCRKISVLKKQ